MSLIDQLRTLTEEVAKRRKQTLSKLDTLILATKVVNVDVANLVNDVQMIGNRQFAENRIQDDDPLTCIGTDDQNVSKSVHNTLQHGDDLLDIESDDESDLKLSAILLKAIELLPTPKRACDIVESEYISELDAIEAHQVHSDSEIEVAIEAQGDIVVSNSENKRGSVVGDSFENGDYEQRLNLDSHRLPTPPPLPATMTNPSQIHSTGKPCQVIDASSIAAAAAAIVSKRNCRVDVASEKNDDFSNRLLTMKPTLVEQPKLIPSLETKKVEEANVVEVSESEKKTALNRDRITDILKKYSLYDEDDEVESDEWD